MEPIPALLSFLVSTVILWFVIRSAVVAALNSHYKTVRLYERQGEWLPGPHGREAPRDLEGTIK